ncbi:MAG: hypothetical protein DRP10_02135 [Candidatus Aenigmatarchaeota archaeon]|nr:MAG: hypothetical protein DRP10_02135 [Candidatus Aenigmarchaeota archaeon]
MVYEIGFGFASYESKNDLDKILQTIPLEEINNFQECVIKSFAEYYTKLNKENIKFDKEQLRTDINL